MGAVPTKPARGFRGSAVTGHRHSGITVSDVGSSATVSPRHGGPTNDYRSSDDGQLLTRYGLLTCRHDCSGSPPAFDSPPSLPSYTPVPYPLSLPVHPFSMTRIDVHAHIVPPVFRKALEDAGGDPAGWIIPCVAQASFHWLVLSANE